MFKALSFLCGCPLPAGLDVFILSFFNILILEVSPYFDFRSQYCETSVLLGGHTFGITAKIELLVSVLVAMTLVGKVIFTEENLDQETLFLT